MTQDPPFLTIEDEAGVRFPPVPVDDNSTVFTIIPGASCVFEVEGDPGAFYYVLVSDNTTGNFGVGQFVAAPFFHLRPGPATYNLNAQGLARISAVVPRNFGLDHTFYIQGVLPGPPIQLTNGITFEITAPSVNADIAVHVGPAAGPGMSAINQVGRLVDNLAEDNQESGDDLLNGETITQIPEFAGQIIAFEDAAPPPGNNPVPSNAIYLNGMSHLVPGDAGLGSGFSYSWDGVDTDRPYPLKGSQLGIHRRNTVCRNFENPAIQHIVIPPIEGGAQVDRNLYHVRNVTNSSYGFMTLNVETNEFTVLTDTFKVFQADMDKDGISSWDCNVAISPDRRLMAAVRKDRVGGGVDELYVIKLDGSGMDQITLNTGGSPPDFIIAESIRFLRTNEDGVFGLFFSTGFDQSPNPPGDSAMHIWRYITNDLTFTANMFDPLNELPKIGTGYDPIFMGKPNKYGETSARLNSSNWLVSGDGRTMIFRVAGRYYDIQSGDSGDWEWDLYAVKDVVTTGDATFVNVTKFSDPRKVAPLGRCYNGRASAALSYDGSVAAFMTINDDDGYDMYLYNTDESDWGEPDLFNRGDFAWSGTFGHVFVAVDPYIVDNDNVLFFYGAVSDSFGWRKMDLFLFTESTGEFRSLTETGSTQTPFTNYGDVSPNGYFISEDGRYMYFFRGNDSAANGIKNLVGVDLQNDYELFGLTGGEFNGLNFVGNIAQAQGNEAEALNLFYSPSTDLNFLYFTAKLLSASQQSYQVFLLDMDHPFSAIQVTRFSNSQIGIIDNLVASDDALTLAFSRGTHATFPDRTENIYAVDLNSYGYTRNLTPPDTPSDAATVDGSLHFIPGNTTPPDPRGPQLIYAYGPQAGGADNPFPARVWAFPLINIANPLVPSTSYPLTANGSVFVYNGIR